MVQSRTRRWALVVWAALLGGAFSLGLQPVWALPACTVCPCKEVIHWWSPGFMGVVARGYKTAGTTTDLASAMTSITTAGGCQSGQQTSDSTCDIWQFSTSYAVCTPAGSVLQEVSVSDSGILVTKGAKSYKCLGSD